MNRTHFFVALATAIACYNLPAVRAGDVNMFVVDSVNNLVIVDVETGRVQRIGPTSAQFTDIAFGSDDRLFGVTSSYLYEVDPANGWSTLIGPHGFGDPRLLAGIDSLAFDLNGTLYAAGNDLLISIDLDTGQGTRIGTLSGHRSAGDLVVDAANRLLLATDSGRLVEVYPNGSGARVIGSLPFDDVYALGVADDGSLWGVRGTNAIVSINGATGRATQTAMFHADFLVGRAWGGAILSHLAPEPTALLLFCGGAIILFRRVLR